MDTDASPTFLDALIRALGQAATFNHQVEAPPAALLWPDRLREWEPLLPRLRGRLPVLVLGSYEPAERVGPATWLRAADPALGSQRARCSCAGA